MCDKALPHIFTFVEKENTVDIDKKVSALKTALVFLRDLAHSSREHRCPYCGVQNSHVATCPLQENILSVSELCLEHEQDLQKATKKG
jgi:DTW domain-containing protein YfiP